MRRKYSRILSCLLVGILLLAGGASAHAVVPQVTIIQEIVVDGAATGIIVDTSERATDDALSAGELDGWNVILEEERDYFSAEYFWGLYYDEAATKPVKAGDLFAVDTVIYRVWDADELTVDPGDAPESGPQEPDDTDLPVDSDEEDVVDPVMPDEDPGDVPNVAPVPELG